MARSVHLITSMRSANANQPQPEHHEMSHISIAALAVGTVVLAGLVLVYVSRHVHEHQGPALFAVFGVPLVILLAILLGKHRRARG